MRVSVSVEAKLVMKVVVVYCPPLARVSLALDCVSANTN